MGDVFYRTPRGFPANLDDGGCPAAKSDYSARLVRPAAAIILATPLGRHYKYISTALLPDAFLQL